MENKNTEENPAYNEVSVKGGRIVKTLRSRNQMIVCVLPGFLLGILYMNLMFKQYGGVKSFYISDFLFEYTQSDLKRRQYFLYILRVRCFEFAALGGMMVTKVRKQAAWLVLIWTGFLFGILMSLSVFSMGMKGSFFCVAAILPQIIFYAAALWILLKFGLEAPYVRWNKQKTEFVGVSLALGILSEIYLNPYLLKLWIKI